MNYEELPPLSGVWSCSESHTWSGYDTDAEEMRSWTEYEMAGLRFLEDGGVIAKIGSDNTPGFQSTDAFQNTLKHLSNQSPNGTWERAERQGYVGYALTLKLPFGIPTFWQSTTPETLVFLEIAEDKLKATRFYSGIAWDETPRQTRLLSRFQID